jgi:hypothetical protein
MARVCGMIFICFLSGSMNAELVANLIPSADSALFEQAPDDNVGGFTDMPCGSTFGNDGRPFAWRALVRFDLSQLLANATIVSATLAVQVVKRPGSPGPGSNFQLFRLLKAWGEGVQNYQTGLPATTGECSWNNRFHPGIPWSSPGALAGVDYRTNISGSIFADDTIAYTFPSNPALIADLQNWLAAPSANFGWIMISDAEGVAATARRFSTREGTFPPLLSIRYNQGQVPPTPTTLQIAGDSSQIRFSFNAESNLTYAIETRTNLDTGNWTTLTNLPASAAATVVNLTNTPSGTRAFFRLRTP